MCGLLSDPTPIILLMYEYWVDDGKNSAGKLLIEAMFQEAGLPVPYDILHNESINYYDHEKGLIKDTTPVHVPSRWYWFDHMKTKVSCSIQHTNTGIPECTLSFIDPETTITKNLLWICKTICEHQAIRKLHLEEGLLVMISQSLKYLT